MSHLICERAPTGVFQLNRDRLFETKYGYFADDGRQYVITRPDTPRPWVNVICPGDYGMIVSQTGGGYSWKTHASLNRLTRWDQDLIRDNWGKYVYLRDEATGQFWSATWKPVCARPERYECRHGMGYTRFISRNFGVETVLTLFVPPDEPRELWRLDITNLGRKKRRLTVWTYFEWCLGQGPDSHREFHKTFIETHGDRGRRTILARKRLWSVPNAKAQHWNRSWDYVGWHSTSAKLRDWSGSKEAFVGSYGNVDSPRALIAGHFVGTTTGKWDDGIASLCSEVTLAPQAACTVVWTLGAAKTTRQALSLAKKYQALPAVERAFNATIRFWRKLCGASAVSTPDAAFDLLANHWLKYQALSARIWGRTGYYQAGGAIGYRDQLQDSQIFLHIDPAKTKRQILLHASRQYPDGIVDHWWHPITEEGSRSRYSDDLLWLLFVTINYLKETGDFSILKESVPFVTGASASLYEHCSRAIEAALRRRSKRGLPLIGTGDWNDGLSAVGWDGKGESVWVAQFLCGILDQFSVAIDRAISNNTLPPSQTRRAQRYRAEATRLRRAVNKHGWDGKWYWAASCDDGTLVGSRRSKEGKIHLNPQTWAILNDIVPANRKRALLDSIVKFLYRDRGVLLLHPAYKTPDEKIGYLTRYAPGVRENGGMYTHAAVWALQMECLLKRNDIAWQLFGKICPIHAAMNPQRYAAEPYVTPGNVDGPDSPHYGRGGWTWYTGSAAWLYRIMTEWMIGVRPEWDGLKIEPCVPAHWQSFKINRLYRGRLYRLRFHRDKTLNPNSVIISHAGKALPGKLISPMTRTPRAEFTVRFN